MINLLLISPILTVIGILINKKLAREIALFGSLITFVISLGLWVLFDESTPKGVYQFSSFLFGADGISVPFVILTTFLIAICILASVEYTKDPIYYISFVSLNFLLVAVFLATDVLLFYILFEAVLIPMFIVIAGWGSRTRKIRAAYQFFLYTLLGSLFMLVALLTIYYETGTTSIQVLTNLMASTGEGETTGLFSLERQNLLWLGFFLSFAVKVPMVPFHIWLPEAHVEAPTAGSVLLAGILLKLGTYGFIRFSLPFFPDASVYFTPLIYTLSIIAVVYTSLTTLRQIDLKKIIAYSSVAHMGLVTIGLFTFNTQGIVGSLIIMISHGFVSSALFLCVGVLYDRYHTRVIKYYQGLATPMPIFATVFLFFTMANLAFPGTSSFVGEMLILFGAFQHNIPVAILAASGMVLGAAYSVWLANRILFGPTYSLLINSWTDMNLREFMIFLPLIIMTLFLGIYPAPIINVLTTFV